ncbi:BRCT domain-containing protein [Klebsiella variicola]|uniref:BRCT domain-containing protein n=1 Tax=Enterobacter cloacae TaxID=550 RepID=UPI00293190B9|nr:BRCT domain-containing protein [Enterobacter cloacae]
MKTICFTGFGKNEKNELIETAKQRGYSVKGDVIKGLSYLCCGENAGPSKINKAKENGSVLLSVADFLNLSPAPAMAGCDKSADTLPTMTIHDEHELLDLLWSLIDAKKAISILYHGGGASGAERSITPLTLLDNFTLRAIDLSIPSHPIKTFSVEKIEVPGIERLSLPPHQSKKRKQKQYSVGVYKNIADVHSALVDTLQGMGWHVATYLDDSGLCNRLDVCDYFKNGKPRKTPVVSLSYQPENQLRPFVCRCRDIEFTSTYAHLDNAAEMFISLAYAGSEDDSEVQG